MPPLDKDLRLKVRLVFWQLFHSGFECDTYLHTYVREGLHKAGYDVKILKEGEKPGFIYVNQEGQEDRLEWLAQTAYRYMPIVFPLAEDSFTTPGGLTGKIKIQVHMHYGGCLLFDCKMDYSDLHTVTEYVSNSRPTDFHLVNYGKDLWSFFMDHLREIKSVLKEIDKVLIEREGARVFHIETIAGPTISNIVHPWHHTWIIHRTEHTTDNDLMNDSWQKDFMKGGRYFKHALGLTQRADDWYDMTPAFFEEEINNHSPYEDSCIYITNAGNVIVPNRALLNVNSFKNKMVDVIFATELGNVQRFLSLVHVTAISEKVLKLQNEIERLRSRKNVDQKTLAREIRRLEIELNRISLEIGDDLMVTRIRRLMFTSILKLTLFQEMIRRLHGNEYREAMNDILVQMQQTVSRERESLEIRQNLREAALLKNLQLVFIISLAAEIITLFFYDPNSTRLDWGAVLFIIAVAISIFLFIAIQYGPIVLKREEDELDV